MKIKRHKKVHKHLNFYVNNFGFRHPFQILIDGTFCHVALKNKINIQDQIPKYLQAEVKLLTTQCVILESEDLGHKIFGSTKILKQFPVHKCGHEKNRVTGAECLKSMIKNHKNARYVIATQDRDLQKILRNIPGIPIMYLHQVAPILEQPSEESLKIAKANTESHLGVSSFQEKILTKLKEKSGIVEDTDKPKRKKKKKGANPLSCLKKKKKSNGDNKIVKKDIEDSGAKATEDKVRRKKIKLPKHIKEELFKGKNNNK